MSTEEKQGLFSRLLGRKSPSQEISPALEFSVLEVAAPVAEDVRPTWFERLRKGLSRTSGGLGDSITSLFTKKKLNTQMLDDLEDILIQADLGLSVSTRITQVIAKGRYDKEIEPEEIKNILSTEIEKALFPVAKPLIIEKMDRPFVIMMVGVNGSGKTTTIGKLSAKFQRDGLSVMFAAGDTFRAAAVEQLKAWGQRTQAAVMAREEGADAAGLVFDAMRGAQISKTDILLVDTAGRLQNRSELMNELEKVIRVMKKVDATAPHAVLLVLDATVGQNALSQVEIFSKMAGVTGLVMTKLDGTARGGILVAVAEKFKLPIHFIGIGEAVDDLEPFHPREFADAIAGLDTRN